MKKGYDEPMSDTFLQAHGLAQYNPERAIELYDQEIALHPDNFVAINNRGVSKMELGEKNMDTGMLEEAKADFIKAEQLCKEFDKGDFPSAKHNISRVEKIISEIAK